MRSETQPTHHRSAAAARRLGDEVQRWLAAEAAGREMQAEEALRGVFALLPLPALPADFPHRVVQAAGLAAPPNLFARRWVRWSIAASILLVGATAAVLPALFALAGPGLDLTLLIRLLTETTSAAAGGLAGAVSAVERTLEMGGLVLRAAQTPSFLLALAAASLLSLAAFRLLTDLALDRGEPRYAEPI